MTRLIQQIARPKFLKNALSYSAVALIVALSGSSVNVYRAGVRTSEGRPTPHDPIAIRSDHVQPVQAYGQLPLSFEANQGQTDAEVKFLARSNGYTLFLTTTEAVLALRTTDNTIQHLQPAPVSMQLVGANPESLVEGRGEQLSRSNYFIGNDPTRWRTDVPHYAQVAYQGVYPGIDLVYYGNQRQLEYDFVVAPGSDPGIITLSFDGADNFEVDNQGDLVLHTASGEIRQHKPFVYQEVEGQRIEVAGAFAIRQPHHEVGFEVGEYDRTRPLIIDPTVVFSSYLGGNGYDQCNDIAVDSNFNVYLTGATTSVVFPRTNPLQNNYGGGSSDVYLTKINAAGNSMVYSTFIGGLSGDTSNGIAVDSAGNAYITGTTFSLDFPTAAPVQRSLFNGADIVVVKLNATGNALLYSTYWGGSNDENGLAIAVDNAGNTVVTGNTRSIDFPILTPLQRNFDGGGASFFGGDAFVTKFNSAGAPLYSTYLGGVSEDSGQDVAVDDEGNAYVIGDTYSTNFPTANPIQATNGGNQDAFVAKINSTGTALIYSTYIGGGAFDRGLGIAVDSTGAAYLTGFTNSTDFFTTLLPFQGSRRGPQDAYVVKLNPAGSARVYSTYLGGNGDDQGIGIAVDSDGSAYITGTTESLDFPRVRTLQQNRQGDRDTFLTKMSQNGRQLTYSTYFGGNGSDRGFSVAVDTIGNAYITGTTDSTNFRTTSGAIQSTFGGGTSDAFFSKISDP